MLLLGISKLFVCKRWESSEQIRDVCCLKDGKRGFLWTESTGVKRRETRRGGDRSCDDQGRLVQERSGKQRGDTVFNTDRSADVCVLYVWEHASDTHVDTHSGAARGTITCTHTHFYSKIWTDFFHRFLLFLNAANYKILKTNHYQLLHVTCTYCSNNYKLCTIFHATNPEIKP